MMISLRRLRARRRRRQLAKNLDWLYAALRNSDAERAAREQENDVPTARQ